MLRLSAHDSDGVEKELGEHANLPTCSEEIREWQENDSNAGTNITDCEITAFDLETGLSYIYTPPDPTQEPAEQYDPDCPYDWTLKTTPIA